MMSIIIISSNMSKAF